MADEVYDGAIGIDLGMSITSLPMQLVLLSRCFILVRHRATRFMMPSPEDTRGQNDQLQRQYTQCIGQLIESNR